LIGTTLAAIFIDLAVAIVVFAITDLCFRGDFIHTGSPATAGTALFASFAGTKAFKLITTSTTTIAGTETGTAQFLVGLAVTIVVFAITGSLGRLVFTFVVGAVHAGIAGKPALFAIALTTCAFAGAFLIAAERPLQIFVYFAIAVVVFTIAAFFFGQDLTRTGAPFACVGTGLTTITADPNATAGRGPRVARPGISGLAVAIFVYLTVAVVVAFVAFFAFGSNRTLTISPGAVCLTGHGAKLTAPLHFAIGESGSGTVKTVLSIAGSTGTTIVDLAVAIVINAVADFGFRGDSAFAGQRPCSTDTLLYTVFAGTFAPF
jgi:hypothetical protein